MFGYLIALALGYIGGRVASSSTSNVLRPAEASQYRIAVGGRFVANVARNGATWAWGVTTIDQVVVASGAGLTATAALRAATIEALAREGDNGAPLDIVRADGRLTVNVFTQGDPQKWTWQVAFDGQPQLSGTASSRSLAAAAMFDKLAPYTER
jgi:hypothetical protein